MSRTLFLSAPLGMSTMESLAAIILVLIMMGNNKMVMSEDQWISMAQVLFKISRWRRGFGCCDDCEPDDRCFAATSISGGARRGDFVLGGVLWAPSLVFRREKSRSNL